MAPEPLIFEQGSAGRRSARLPECDVPGRDASELLAGRRLRRRLDLPEVSELDVVRHFTRLSHLNYSIDTGIYPLGSCTMKYNPKVNELCARLPGFSRLHPLQPEATVQGALQVLFETQAMLAQIAGMAAATVQPSAGAHGELLSLMIVREYHLSRGERLRQVVLIPDSAHGTNPASAARCGFKVKAIPADARGLTDVAALARAAGPDTAAVMLTNPNTLGLFESDISQVCRIVHDAGGLVYCDGANMNALLGLTRPGDMGFDVMHFNLHKTFSTPHGGGGPGCGAIAVGEALEPFLPVPVVTRGSEGAYSLCYDRPQSVGAVHSFYGAFLVALRAYAYILTLGPEGLRNVAEMAVLNANYVRAKLRGLFDIPQDRACMHEVVISATRQKNEHGVRALDISKRLMDYGIHPPTNYFPIIVPEALMIEPTETESREALDVLCAALASIARECSETPDVVKGAPHTTAVSRMDETAAVRNLDIRWRPAGA